jgi:glucosylceramidase
MNYNEKRTLLGELFGLDGKNIAVSFNRLSISASVLSDRESSYKGLPARYTDYELKKLYTKSEIADFIPLRKQRVSIN